MLNIALIAHDRKKHDLVEFVVQHKSFFKNIRIIATGNTGSLIEHVELDVIKMKSGPMGGDSQIAALITEGQIDAVIFLIDPLDVHPHQVDVRMLLRLCNVYNVPLATNIATAKLLVKSL
jgi:methylglyoxal synthase